MPRETRNIVSYVQATLGRRRWGWRNRQEQPEGPTNRQTQTEPCTQAAPQTRYPEQVHVHFQIHTGLPGTEGHTPSLMTSLLHPFSELCSPAFYHSQTPARVWGDGAGGAHSDLATNHRMSNCSSGGGTCVCVGGCPFIPSFIVPPPPTPLPARGSFRNRPAAENSLAGGGCKRSAVERFN